MHYIRSLGQRACPRLLYSPNLSCCLCILETDLIHPHLSNNGGLIFRFIAFSSAVKPTPVVLVSAFLLLERSKGDKSLWHYYLRSVPSDYTTLICMHEGDVDVLDSELRQKYEAMLNKIKQ